MLTTRTDCVNCDPCVDCGAKTPYPVVLCDKCGEEIEDNDDVYLGSTMYDHLCAGCALSLLESVRARDIIGM